MASMVQMEALTVGAGFGWSISAAGGTTWLVSVMMMGAARVRSQRLGYRLRSEQSNPSQQREVGLI